jgi:hypothetical protein
MHHVVVKKCQVNQCCLNRNGECHSLAIQVGDSVIPACDTYTNNAPGQCGLQDLSAEVGACKVVGCTYNHGLLCDAPGIDVGWKDNQPECLTYSKKNR